MAADRIKVYGGGAPDPPRPETPSEGPGHSAPRRRRRPAGRGRMAQKCHAPHRGGALGGAAHRPRPHGEKCTAHPLPVPNGDNPAPVPVPAASLPPRYRFLPAPRDGVEPGAAPAGAYRHSGQRAPGQPAGAVAVREHSVPQCQGEPPRPRTARPRSQKPTELGIVAGSCSQVPRRAGASPRERGGQGGGAGAALQHPREGRPAPSRSGNQGGGAGAACGGRPLNAGECFL